MLIWKATDAKKLICTETASDLLESRYIVIDVIHVHDVF